MLNAPMVARDRKDQSYPAFGVFEWLPNDLPVSVQKATSALATTAPKDLTYTVTETGLPSLGQKLTFLGIKRGEYDESIEVNTWWRVEESSITRPVSLMAHLVTDDGQTLDIADGLNISPLIWQRGDVIIQQHTFSASCNGEQKLWLRTGVYWLDSVERWEIGDTGHDAIFIRICEDT
jgi:hypothetical protein